MPEPRERRLRRWLLTRPGPIRRDTGVEAIGEARARAGMMGVPLAEFERMLDVAGYRVRSERKADGGGYRVVLPLLSKPT